MSKIASLAAALCCALMSGPARGGDKDACATAFENGQRTQRRGAYLEARRELRTCLRECGEAIRADCMQWLEEVERLLPSVVVAVRRPDGTDVADAAVSIAGVSVTSASGGRATDLDPGAHEIVVEAEGRRIVKQVVLQEGEQGRSIIIVLEPPALPTPEAATPRDPAESRPVWLVTGVLGGLAVAGLATFGALTIHNENKYAKLERCRPRCEPNDVSSLQTTLIAGDVSLLTGLVCAGLAITSYVFLREPKPASVTTMRAPDTFTLKF